MGHYRDSFNWASTIDLKRLHDVHWIISDTYIYPHYTAIPELRRNGMRGRLPDCHPMRFMKALLSDHRIETMTKAKDHRAVAYFVSHTLELDKCWQSYKIAVRHHYMPTDYGMWCDTVSSPEKS